MSGGRAEDDGCPRAGLALQTLRLFGQVSIRATGGSMLPAIAPGDVLTFRACDAIPPQPGHVVLFEQRGRLVAHRLVARAADTVTTRGDALAATDDPLELHSLLGVLVAQRRGRRHLHAGGRHWLRRQRLARWLIRRAGPVHRLFCRVPLLATLSA